MSQDHDDDLRLDFLDDAVSKEVEKVTENSGADMYPWAGGDRSVMLRSFIFQIMCDPDFEGDMHPQLIRMQAFADWIKTGNYKGRHLKLL